MRIPRCAVCGEADVTSCRHLEDDYYQGNCFVLVFHPNVCTHCAHLLRSVYAEVAVQFAVAKNEQAQSVEGLFDRLSAEGFDPNPLPPHPTDVVDAFIKELTNGTGPS